MRAAMLLRTAILDQSDDDELLRGACAALCAQPALRLCLRTRWPRVAGVCAAGRGCSCARSGRKRRADARRVPRCATALGLPLGDFRCRFAVASLHLWLTLVRLRAEGDEGKRLGQARPLSNALARARQCNWPTTPL